MKLVVTYKLSDDRSEEVEYEVADAAEAAFMIASLRAALDQLLERMRNPRPLPDTPFSRMGLKSGRIHDERAARPEAAPRG